MEWVYVYLTVINNVPILDAADGSYKTQEAWFLMLARIGAKQKLFGVPPRERPATDSFDPLDRRGPQMHSNASHLFAWQQRR